MMVCVDVAYGSRDAVVACVGFRDWTDEQPIMERTLRVTGAPPPYKPGEFYQRELPYLLGGLSSLGAAPTLIVVDGYVWLGRGRPGLGAKLHDELRQRVPVIGIAKRPFRGNDAAMPVYRSKSKQPLYVTTTGSDLLSIAAQISRMHGRFRVPTMLRRVDQLTRAR